MPPLVEFTRIDLQEYSTIFRALCQGRCRIYFSVVENVKLLHAPAPPDSQAPLQIFILKAAHNCVLCHHGSLRENPAERRGLRKPTGVPAWSGQRPSPCTFSEDRAWLRGHLCTPVWHQRRASLSGGLACRQSF